MMKTVTFIMLLVTIGIVLSITHMIVSKRVETFAWTLPHNCYLVVVNPPQYSEQTICYYVKSVEKVVKNTVQISGCYVDINNVTDKSRLSDCDYFKIRIPASWIISKRTSLLCFDLETLKQYIDNLRKTV